MALITIPFTVTGQQLEFSQPMLAEHAVGSIGASFSFSTEWATLTTRTATFATFGASYDVALVSDACTVPSEVLTASSFRVSVRGSDGTHVLTTTIARIGVKDSLIGGDTPAAPTPSVYDQLVAQATAAATDAAQAMAAATSAQSTATAVQAALDSKQDALTVRDDSYNPDYVMEPYCTYENAWSVNNEYVQGMAINNDTLYIGATPISGGIAHIYRYPNFAKGATLTSDASIQLTISKNSHANCLTVYDGILYVTDGGIANANCNKIARVNLETFTELQPMTLWFGGITDICIQQPSPTENPSYLYIYGSGYDIQAVDIYQGIYDTSTKEISLLPNVIQSAMYQSYNNRQASAYYKNTRMMLYSGRGGSNNAHRQASYIICSDPFQASAGNMIPLPCGQELEGLAVYDNLLLVNGWTTVYSLGDVENYRNQVMTYSELRRGLHTNAMCHMQFEISSVPSDTVNIGIMYLNRFKNIAVGSVQLTINFPGHNPSLFNIPVNREIAFRPGVEFSASVDKSYAGIGRVTYVVYYKFTEENYMLGFTINDIQLFVNGNQYNYADIPSDMKPGLITLDYNDAN